MQHDRRNARDYTFLALFAVSLAWALLQLGVMLMLLSGEDGALNPAKQISALPAVVEDWGPAVITLVAAGLITAFLVRIARGFLRLPAHVTLLRLSLSLIVTAAIVAAAILATAIAVTTIVDPPGPRPENPQYIPLAFWIAPWLTHALTPVASVLIAWGWTARKSRG